MTYCVYHYTCNAHYYKIWLICSICEYSHGWHAVRTIRGLIIWSNVVTYVGDALCAWLYLARMSATLLGFTRGSAHLVLVALILSYDWLVTFVTKMFMCTIMSVFVCVFCCVCVCGGVCVCNWAPWACVHVCIHFWTLARYRVCLIIVFFSIGWATFKPFLKLYFDA